MWSFCAGWPDRVDVMITIFCDFRSFSAKKLSFFSKTNVMIKILRNLALFWVKNAIFSADFFGENIEKIITSVPDRVNFHPLYTFGQFLEITELAHIFGYLFPLFRSCINFDKKWGWATFRATFFQFNLVTLLLCLSAVETRRIFKSAKFST
jgi:hypothetical protein